MAIDWSKPIRVVHNKLAVTNVRPACGDVDNCMAVDIPGDERGRVYWKHTGNPKFSGPPIENYEPEPEVKPVTVDWTKPVQTKRGTKLRVLCTDAPGVYPVVVMAPSGGINKYPLETTRIINVPEKRTGYINIYENSCGSVQDSRGGADLIAGSNRIACIKVEYTVGQFDT